MHVCITSSSIHPSSRTISPSIIHAFILVSVKASTYAIHAPVQPFIRFIHSAIHVFIRPFIYSSVHAFTCIHPSIHWFHSSIHPVIHLIHPCILKIYSSIHACIRSSNTFIRALVNLFIHLSMWMDE